IQRHWQPFGVVTNFRELSLDPKWDPDSRLNCLPRFSSGWVASELAVRTKPLCGGRCRVGEVGSGDDGQREIDCGSQGGPCDPSTQNHAGGTPGSKIRVVITPRLPHVTTFARSKLSLDISSALLIVWGGSTFGSTKPTSSPNGSCRLVQ